MTPIPETDRDVLISRLIDGRAGAADWAALRQIASADATVWSDLAESSRLDGSLGALMGTEVARADRVELPGSPRFGGAPIAGRIAVPARLGWAVAAVLGLSLVGVLIGVRPGSTNISPLDGGHGAALGGFTRPAEALAAYMQLGRQDGSVVGEMPQRFVVDTRPVEGGTEVTYVRQIVEKALVKDFYKLGTDETGRPVLLPASSPGATPGASPASNAPM
ncbi:MAG: hypothetical protein JNJ48_04885 [Phycisphaerae bacterium]|nr:hypothetical protein [Phycisphaerae bacterium]